MKATDRLTRRGRAAAASIEGRGVLRRNDAGDLVPLDGGAGAGGGGSGTISGGGDVGSASEARLTVRQIDGQGYAR